VVGSAVAAKYIQDMADTSDLGLRAAQKQIMANYPGFDPIVFDLNGDGINLLDVSHSTATFDLDHDGFRENIAWVGASDGILVIDLHGEGVIDDIDELTFAQSGQTGATDLERLRGHDSNSDGVLDASDAAFGSFFIWQDLNQNGISESGELVDLNTAGITSVDLGGTPVTGGVGERGGAGRIRQEA
jgi:hypothetical protein